MTPNTQRDEYKKRLKANVLVDMQRKMVYHQISVEELMEFLKTDFAEDIHTYLQTHRAKINREVKRRTNLAASRIKANEVLKEKREGGR